MNYLCFCPFYEEFYPMFNQMVNTPQAVKYCQYYSTGNGMDEGYVAVHARMASNAILSDPLVIAVVDNFDLLTMHDIERIRPQFEKLTFKDLPNLSGNLETCKTELTNFFHKRGL